MKNARKKPARCPRCGAIARPHHKCPADRHWTELLNRAARRELRDWRIT